MAVRYHINPETGRANICRAKIKCDFTVNEVEPPHYNSKDEAKKGAEKSLQEEYGSSFGGGDSSKSLKVEEKNNQESVENNYTDPIDLKASQIKAGDIVFGEKFVNGKWKEDSAQVDKVETEIDLNLKEKTFITYKNGNQAEFAGRAPVKVRKPKGFIPSDKDPKELEKIVKTAYKKTRGNPNDIDLTNEEIESVIDSLNDDNANDMTFAYGKRFSDYLENENYQDASIRVDSAVERNRLSKDSNAKINNHFSLIYDQKTPDALFQKAVEEKPETLERVKDLYEINGRKWTRDDM